MPSVGSIQAARYGRGLKIGSCCRMKANLSHNPTGAHVRSDVV